MNPDRPPPPSIGEGENRESNESEPLTIHVYAQEVRATFRDEAGVRKTEDKTWYRWEGRLWESRQGKYVPGDPSYKQESEVEKLAQNLRTVSDSKAIPERKQQRLPSYKLALYPREDIKRKREEELNKADNVIKATIRSLTPEEIDRFRHEYSGETKKTIISQTPTAQREKVIENISGELKQRLLESAQAAHMQPEDALMTESLRQLLDDVRTNYPVYLHLRFQAGEHPLGQEEYGTTGNKKALEVAQGSWFKVNQSQESFSAIQADYLQDSEKGIEVLGLQPQKNQDTRTLLYWCRDPEAMNGSNLQSPNALIKAWIDLPTKKAEALHRKLEHNPQFIRQFFIATTLDAPGSQHLWKGDKRRRPPSPSNEIIFYNETSEHLDIFARQGRGTTWQETKLSSQAQKIAEKAQAEIQWQHQRKQQEKLRPPKPEKKSAWQKFKDWL